MKKLYVYFSVIILTLIGCAENKNGTPPDSGVFFSENFIQVYVEFETFEVFYISWANALQIRAEGKEYYNTGNPVDEQYTEYAEKYGDTYFNRYMVPYSNRVFENEFTSVNIFSDEDFDDSHPAGTSLNDIIKICAASPLKFIRSGYVDTYDWRQKPDDIDPLLWNGNYGYHPVYMPVSELTQSDLVLLEYWNILLLFTSAPAIKEHTITVTFMEGERKFESSVDVVFE